MDTWAEAMFPIIIGTNNGETLAYPADGIGFIRANFASNSHGAFNQGGGTVRLLRNGMDAMEAQSERTLELQVCAQGGQVHITVRDQGPGLSDDVLKHLF
ncbi:MAG TPA: hypothetical protein PLC49_05230, partial [Caldisericia bacterium]|nr:hypothetical protein [Caldisericia bacterium]